MKILYEGKGECKDGNIPWPRSRMSQLVAPEKYLPDPGLIDAANVALMLGQPLLLTGEAGTGKTQFAYSVAWELGLGKPFKFVTKSTSSARDLFYTYDALKRFQDVQSGLKPDNILPYITYQALGAAILRTRPIEEIQDLVNRSFPGSERPARSVVLIDEIDKAPRDFPNDILNEIELREFSMPEMGNRMFRADPDLAPIIIITSNSEKDLPDAFLRRCVYYHIPFPNKEALQAIVSNRLGTYVSGASPFIDDALDLFVALREAPGGLRKNPSVAEMLGWMLAMKDLEPDAENPLLEGSLALRTLSNLIKTTADQEKAHAVVEEWLSKRQTPV